MLDFFSPKRKLSCLGCSEVARKQNIRSSGFAHLWFSAVPQPVLPSLPSLPRPQPGSPLSYPPLPLPQLGCQIPPLSNTHPTSSLLLPLPQISQTNRVSHQIVC